MMLALPDPFIQTITRTFGEAGRDWLARLPALVEECCQTWSLTLAEPFSLSYNYVAPGMRTDSGPVVGTQVVGTQVVLKIGVPNVELAREMAALRLCAGQGMVCLLDSIPERGAMLLERILPGTRLSSLQDDDEATRILASQMRRIWQPLGRQITGWQPPDPDQAGLPTALTNESAVFVRLEQWTDGIRRYGQVYRGRGPIPQALFDRAQGMLDDFLASQGEPFLLHGDLHHENVLRSERDGWLAIDPKGVAGEREFDAGPMMWNPWQRIQSWPDLQAVLGRRLDILHDELGLDRQRLLGWCFIEAVLSMVWEIEDGSPEWDHGLPVAEVLGALMQKGFNAKTHRGAKTRRD